MSVSDCLLACCCTCSRSEPNCVPGCSPVDQEILNIAFPVSPEIIITRHVNLVLDHINVCHAEIRTCKLFMLSLYRH